MLKYSENMWNVPDAAAAIRGQPAVDGVVDLAERFARRHDVQQVFVLSAYPPRVAVRADEDAAVGDGDVLLPVVRGHGFVVILRIDQDRCRELPLIIQAARLTGFFSRLAEHGEQQGREDGDHGDHHQQFDEGKSPAWCPSHLLSFLRFTRRNESLPGNRKMTVECLPTNKKRPPRRAGVFIDIGAAFLQYSTDHNPLREGIDLLGTPSFLASVSLY